MSVQHAAHAVIVENGKLHGQQLADRLLQIVYDKGACRTGEIRKALGTYEHYTITCGHSDCENPQHRRRQGKNSYWNSDFTPTLRKLAKRGEIVRVAQRKANQGDEWRAPDYQSPDVEPTPLVLDDEGEWALLALAGRTLPPPRCTHSEYTANGYRTPRGKIHSSDVGKARGRAVARVVEAHRSEFDRYWLEEQWKIVDEERT